MRKRRAENSSLQESPQKKKKCSSVCDAERELEVVNVLHADTDTTPALFTTLIGEHRRKRPRCCEDHEQHGKLSNVTDGIKKDTEDECVSGKFLRANDTCTCEMESEESASWLKDTRTKVTLPEDNTDELCAFNSFQFWRTPLPALDLSLLDTPSSAEFGKESSLKDATEEMET